MTPIKNKKDNGSKSASLSSGKFAHAMRREIYEQPAAIAKTIEKHLENDILFPGELEPIAGALLLDDHDTILRLFARTRARQTNH